MQMSFIGKNVKNGEEAMQKILGEGHKSSV